METDKTRFLFNADMCLLIFIGNTSIYEWVKWVKVCKLDQFGSFESTIESINEMAPLGARRWKQFPYHQGKNKAKERIIVGNSLIY